LPSDKVNDPAVIITIICKAGFSRRGFAVGTSAKCRRLSSVSTSRRGSDLDDDRVVRIGRAKAVATEHGARSATCDGRR
jgi:hypothetical protein